MSVKKVNLKQVYVRPERERYPYKCKIMLGWDTVGFIKLKKERIIYENGNSFTGIKLVDVHVNQGFRQQGIASTALKELLGLLARNLPLYAECRRVNVAGTRLLESLGFEFLAYNFGKYPIYRKIIE